MGKIMSYYLMDSCTKPTDGLGENREVSYDTVPTVCGFCIIIKKQKHGMV